MELENLVLGGLTSGQQRGICFVFSVHLRSIFHFYEFVDKTMFCSLSAKLY